ncbi:unnamed protein product [Oreochromis niloticus]|nr:unnamed protein product [Mustela putorius furo]
MEERIRCGRRTVIIFIDFKSAFDCIDRPALWRALAAEHIPLKIIELLRTAYNGSTSQVRIRDEVSEEFPIMTGVRQGDVVSPLLFNIIIDAIMCKAFEGRRGVQASTDRFIIDLVFAGDIGVFAGDDTKVTDILFDIAWHSKPYGLKINAEKTKVLTTDGSPAIVHLDGVQIKQVQQFKYLGSLVEEKKVASSVEIRSRIGQAVAAFASLRWCAWKKNNISLATKVHLYQTLILPILLYGAETWTMLKHDLSKLDVFQCVAFDAFLAFPFATIIRMTPSSPAAAAN